MYRFLVYFPIPGSEIPSENFNTNLDGAMDQVNNHIIISFTAQHQIVSSIHG